MLDFLRKIWRPLLGLQFVLTLFVNYALLPIFGYDLLVLPDGYWQVHLIAIPVLIGGRSWEKIANGKAGG